MTSLSLRAALSCCALLLASPSPVLSADNPSSVAIAASLLTTKLTSDDTWMLSTGKLAERQLSITFSTHIAGLCMLTIHRDATSTYPYIGKSVASATAALTYYMLPLDKMSDGLIQSNVSNGQQAATWISGSSHSQVFTYSEDTALPLAGLKTDVEPVAVSSQAPVPKYPTFTDAAGAKAAITALANAAASCAGSSAK